MEVGDNHFYTIQILVFFNFNFFNCIYFWLCQVFVAAHGLSLVVASGGYSLLWCAGFLLRWLLLLRSTGSRCAGFSSCGTQAQQLWLVGSRAQAQQLWHTGLVALRRVGSSRTRARIRVPCTGRWILNHCATREVPQILVLNNSREQRGKLYILCYTLWVRDVNILPKSASHIII